MSHSSKACCTLPPVESDYASKGEHVAISASLDAYVVGPADAKKAIVMVYDIFGYHPATKQVVDLLSEGASARVIMPDLLKDNAWPLSNFPPKDPTELGAWFGTVGTWAKVGPHVKAALAYAKQHGATSVALVGLCWGCRMSIEATKELAGDLIGAALLHPAMLTAEDIKGAKRPLCILPSKDEGDYTAIETALSENEFKDQNKYKQFSDMHHGWCGARADFTSELNRTRTHEALEIVTDFFNAIFA